jgi:ribosome biogenesis protein Tsr3
LGNTLVILRTVKKAVGKVDSIKVTRSGLVLVNCVDEEQKKRAMDLAKLHTSEVPVFLFVAGRLPKEL